MLRYWHTLRHLRPVQFFGRAWHYLHTPSPDLRPTPGLRVPSIDWNAPARHRATLQEPDTFRCLNEVGRLALPEDWNGPGHNKLWLYNLHYFDDLTARGADTRVSLHRALIARWIAENPPGQGNGWEPYPLSRRIANWAKWALAGHVLDPVCSESLAIQARYLRARIEWHLLGNHLFANAKALIFAGSIFEGREADAWRAKGLEILTREVREQILSDGGHFERSPMYHAIILEDLLDLINLARAFPETVPNACVQSWRDAVQRMRRWLAAMSHPDGGIAFFNDAAFGIAPAASELEAYAEGLGLGPRATPEGDVTHFPESGYVRVQRGEAAALLDVARVGPDFQPGHAHADTLSFELSLFGQRLVVNSGTSVYGTGRERLRQRSTSAHSTVEIDGENSSDVWGGFRVARRALPFDLEIADPGDVLLVRCAHDGYRRLAGRVVHRRQWRFGERSLSVTDRIEGAFKDAVARFYIHPEVTLVGEGREGSLSLQTGQIVRWRLAGSRAKIIASTWHPEFGMSIPSQCLEARLTQLECSLTLQW